MASDAITCAHCGEPIPGGIPPELAAITGPAPVFGFGLHNECAVRMTIGSLGHQLGLCHCPGKPGIMDDPPGLTVRQAAITASAFFASDRGRLEALARAFTSACDIPCGPGDDDGD